MASGTTSLPVRSAFGQTARTDAWWVQPVVGVPGSERFSGITFRRYTRPRSSGIRLTRCSGLGRAFGGKE